MNQRGGYRPRPEPAPKPYGMIPRVSGVIKRDRPHGHDRFKQGMLTGTMTGTIMALSAIHLASGVLELGEDLPLPPTGGRNPDLVMSFVRSNGVPVIPGSSLKGAIRSAVEAISPSCICKTLARSHQRAKDLDECREKESLCVACRMFGAMGFQGNIRLDDARLQPDAKGRYKTGIEPVPSLFQPRDNRRAYYDQEGKIIGRKFYMHGRRARGNRPIEFCPEKSVFSFTFRFENLEYEELGLLFTAMGLSETYQFALKLGGAKPVCFGTVKFDLDSLVALRSLVESYLDFDDAASVDHAEGESSSKYIGDLLKDYVKTASKMALADRNLVREEQVRQLAEILRFPNNRDCPSGLY